MREFQPEVPVSLDKQIFLKSLQSARRGSSPGPGGWTYEHLKILMDEMDVFDLVFEAASSVAQGRVPADIQGPLMSARLTALSKDDGGVRGIATGCTFRRLVARSLARQFAEDFEKECAPFQYALSTRAGTDCVGHMDNDNRATILKVDGIGRIRPCVAVGNDGSVDHDAQSAIFASFRPDVLRHTIEFIRGLTMKDGGVW